MPLYLLTILCLLIISGCEKNRNDFSPTIVALPAKSEPHVILTSGRSTLHRGETANITVTFVNPTNKKLILPEESMSKGEYDNIDHRLVVEWKEKNGISTSPISALSIHSSPPSLSYLAPGQSKSFRIQWKHDDHREGIATLKYQFGWSDDFPPAEITFDVR